MRIGRALITTLALGALLSLAACGETTGVSPPAESPDASAAPDAGAPDAEVAADAGEGLDAGAEPDAGGEPDAGLTPDAGLPVDPLDCPPLVHDGTADDYSNIDHLRDDALRAKLLQRVQDNFALTYDGAKWALFGDDGVDVFDGKVECLYTGQLFLSDQLDTSGGYNVEHTWPQSEFPGEGGPKSDLHHLFAAERNANSSRGSLPFGETDCDATYCRFEVGGSEIGPRIGTENALVFDVRPEKRGEVARAHFYFAVRYDMYIPGTEEEALKRWNRCDPPDDLERARNDLVEARQHNRNPFVDRPELVDAIADY